MHHIEKTTGEALVNTTGETVYDASGWSFMPADGSKPGRTDATTAKYLKRAQQLLMAIPANTLANPDTGAHPSEIVAWLVSRATGLRKATVRQYKAAIGCYFEHMADQYPESEGEYRAALEQLGTDVGSALAPQSKELPKRTSAGKVKKIPLDDLAKLGQSMLAKKAFWPSKAYAYLVAGMVSGLRPCEWQYTEIKAELNEVEITTGSLYLVVKNAKNTNGRACGDYREIEIPEGWMVDYVQAHMQNVTHWLTSGKEFESFYNLARLALGQNIKSLWADQPSRQYTLYSGRHQFCATLKKGGHTMQVIAGQMGHASDRTAQEHYGKRRSGHDSVLLKQIIMLAPKMEPKASPSSGMSLG